jgi:hypothetical protein
MTDLFNKSDKKSDDDYYRRILNMIFGYINGCGIRGATCSEIGNALDMKRESIFIHVGTLNRQKKVIWHGYHRQGERVYEAPNAKP